MTSSTPWWQSAVVYQIYPRSFADSNGDGIGDLPGITEHLDYLAKLGVDVLWLCPVYRSPNDDNGYDISDYRSIMAEYGTMADFDRLLSEAHARNLRIVMDLVVNHTSDEHAWFVESRKDTVNAKRDWYIWRNGKNGGAPNNWRSCFNGPAWEYDPATGMYYLHLFSPKQPDLNWENPEVRDAVFDLMDFWCQKGIDGFRMDVISMISKVPGLPDGEAQADGLANADPFVCNGPRVHEYLQEMNRRVLSRYDLMTVGETPGVTVEEAGKYARLDGRELNMVFHFEHVSCLPGLVGKWTDQKPALSDFRPILNKWQTALEGRAWNSLFWDNHDQPRAVSRFGDDSPRFRVLSAKLLAACLHMMKGTPYIYQGEELGMTNIPLSRIEDYRDVETLGAWQRYVVERPFLSPEKMLACLNAMSRDNARTPMQWTAGKNAGFTEGEPWIAVNPNHTEINAEAALADEDSVFWFYHKLIELRHSLPVVVHGVFIPLLEDDPCVYAYERRYEGRVLTCLCNFSGETIPCALSAERTGKELLSNYPQHQEGALQPWETRILLR